MSPSSVSVASGRLTASLGPCSPGTPIPWCQIPALILVVLAIVDPVDHPLLEAPCPRAEYLSAVLVICLFSQGFHVPSVGYPRVHPHSWLLTPLGISVVPSHQVLAQNAILMLLLVSLAAAWIPHGFQSPEPTSPVASPRISVNGTSILRSSRVALILFVCCAHSAS